ncbi:putative D-xylulose reductase A [Grifola frondosa]|uniref:Putative D-xylulose reductase A n=1 Tax=Grifola frondosa TaxID=5627 RepID=A0A1C7M2H1_GRIFR|nr:putative D-xylulose reductase A [Grifola frondosa]
MLHEGFDSLSTGLLCAVGVTQESTVFGEHFIIRSLLRFGSDLVLFEDRPRVKGVDMYELYPRDWSARIAASGAVWNGVASPSEHQVATWRSHERPVFVELTSRRCCLLHITRRAVLIPSSPASALVFSVSTINLLACALAKSYGASRVVAININQSRLCACAGLPRASLLPGKQAEMTAGQFLQGAEMTLLKAKATHDELRCAKETIGAVLGEFVRDGFDVVSECTGAEPYIQMSIRAVVTGGKLMLAGMELRNVVLPVCRGDARGGHPRRSATRTCTRARAARLREAPEHREDQHAPLRAAGHCAHVRTLLQSYGDDGNITPAGEADNPRPIPSSELMHSFPPSRPAPPQLALASRAPSHTPQSPYSSPAPTPRNAMRMQERHKLAQAPPALSRTEAVLKHTEFRDVARDAIHRIGPELRDIPRSIFESLGVDLFQVLAGVTATPLVNSVPKEFTIVMNNISSDMPTRVLAIYAPPMPAPVHPDTE